MRKINQDTIDSFIKQLRFSKQNRTITLGYYPENYYHVELLLHGNSIARWWPDLPWSESSSKSAFYTTLAGYATPTTIALLNDLIITMYNQGLIPEDRGYRIYKGNPRWVDHVISAKDWQCHLYHPEVSYLFDTPAHTVSKLVKSQVSIIPTLKDVV